MTRFGRLLSVIVVYGVCQALVQTAVFAFLHRDLLLAPYRFFPGQAWGAFTKLYLVLVDLLPLPPILEDFLDAGLAAKLVLAPGIVAANTAMAVLVAAVLAVLSRPLARKGEPSPLGLLAAVLFGLHVANWANAFHSPEAITTWKLARAVVRDILQGGLLVALGVMGASLAVTAAVLKRPLVAGAARAAALVTLVGLGLGGFGSAGATVEAKPGGNLGAGAAPAAGYNVVLISIDSLRSDHLGAYGYARPTSPTLDAMAADGVLFRRHSSTSSWTLPAHMSLLTGRSLLGHGVISHDRSLPKSVGTVAEVFQAAGYETHAVVSAPYVQARYGFAKGFDDYDDRTIYFSTNEDSYRSVTSPILVETATRFLETPRDRPFFLFLHFWDVHYDYAPGAPYDRMFDPDYTGTMDGENFYFDPRISKNMDRRDLEHLLALYDGEIRLVDDHLAKLRTALARLGLADRTIVAVTADHGDEFFEHGNKGHHRTLYGEVLDTPFVLHVPGRTPSRRAVEAESSLADVGPTLLGLAGLAAPAGSEGRDWSGLYSGAALPEPGPVYAELYRTGTLNVQVAEIDARRKLIHHFQKREAEAYDLAADPGEQSRLPLAGPEARRLMSTMRDWIDGRWHRFDRRLRVEGITPVVMDPKMAEQLRSLGYLQ